MRSPNFELDGWCLEDGEQYHREAPKTFEIPDLEVRKILDAGDFAKLIFRIALDNEDAPESFERMWVIVSRLTETGYIGVLDNQPSTIEENDSLWVGTELPFEPRHIISVEHGSEASLAIAMKPAPIPWIG